jgi:hypothetical protein
MDKRPRPPRSQSNSSVHQLGATNLSPFHKGLKDFFRGQLVNPYQAGTQDNRDWEFGFNKSYFSNLERVNGKNQKSAA